jgi:hypothetical protein
MHEIGIIVGSTRTYQVATSLESALRRTEQCPHDLAIGPVDFPCRMLQQILYPGHEPIA